MIDIAKCKGGDCPLKDTCYRYKAVTGILQTFFLEIPYKKEEEKCKYYMSTEEEINDIL